MSDSQLSQVLIDGRRQQAFLAIAELRARSEPLDIVSDAVGILWESRRTGRTSFGVPSQGPGWTFDEPLRSALLRDGAVEQSDMVPSDEQANVKQAHLTTHVGRVKFGARCSRVCFLLHDAAMRESSSTLLLPDVWLGRMVFGGERDSWPKNWRISLLNILDGMTYLHVTGTDDEAVQFGSQTALLHRVVDLRGQDCECSRLCAECDRKHSHFLVVLGRGFLGCLEQCVVEEDSDGTRTYDFHNNKKVRPLSKKGLVVGAYKDPLFADPRRGLILNPRLQRLLAAIVRELSFAKGKKGSPRTELVIKNATIPSTNGQKTLTCPLLDDLTDYVCFGGNGVRSGLGYLIASAGGWMAKCGYAPNESSQFIEDLRSFNEQLGIIAVGIRHPSQSLLRIDELSQIAANRSASGLVGVHLRLYAASGFPSRWESVFAAIVPGRAPNRSELAANYVREFLSQYSVPQKDLATAAKVDPSQLSKILKGTKLASPASIKSLRSGLITIAGKQRSSLIMPAMQTSGQTELPSQVARYLDLGWSIIPQRHQEKKPHVNWKEYQTERPTEQDWLGWIKEWPNAGIGVVLGPVSNLLVIDVDGHEAHEVLLDHLGIVPVAPRVRSGSHEADRYHLFFRHPDFDTRAKVTPWHPKLEFRGHGGQAVLPPSVHKSGNDYQWYKGQTPWTLLIPQLPTPILEALLNESVVLMESEPRPEEPTTEPSGQVAPSTAKMLSGELAEAANWNDNIFCAACDLSAKGVPIEEAMSKLLQGAKPRTSIDHDLLDRTVRSAYSQPRARSRS